MARLAQIVLVAALMSVAAAINDKGIIYLDDLTFDKVVDRSRDVLVRFDKEYPWGDEHDAFKELGSTVGGSDTPLLVVGVPISNSETYPVNPKLALRYGVATLKDDDFPVYKLFKKGADTTKPLAYEGVKAAAAILKWTVKQTGVFVGVKARKTPNEEGLRGQIKELDAAAAAFMAAAPSARSALLADARAAADEIDVSSSPDAPAYIEYYIRVMQRVLDKGDAYVEQESKRLAKMAEDKAVAAAKRETFAWRANVLASFDNRGSADKEEL